MAKPRQQLLSTLAAYEATAHGLDDHPLSVDLWRLLLELGSEGNELFVRCKGVGQPFKDDTEGLDVFFVLRRRELCAAMKNPKADPAIVGKVSDWLLLPHLRERVEAVVR